MFLRSAGSPCTRALKFAIDISYDSAGSGGADETSAAHRFGWSEEKLTLLEDKERVFQTNITLTAISSIVSQSATHDAPTAIDAVFT
jgi:hypothetical protein